ncbi:CD209 antigen isoform X1 [Enhydra lutris kenyoni]|uniref:CD209 antigen isoform X1 n=1 Tax=Enhydra lutris kenyoni TaxID=391180 RepID=A0A2Y9LCV5_ENHLU|nr:CD209 antigen isoform X1 [Enhydra lutris kenyoni]
MAEMCDSKDLGDPEEEMFGDRRVTKKYTGLLRGSRILPGCLTQAQLPLLLLLVSMGFFLLLVATLVQVSSVRQSLQKEKWDHQQSPSQVGVSQKPPRSDLDEILQQLTWINATLAGLCRPCPWKWELFQGTCYFFSQTQNIWKDAISACQNLRAQLVIINSTEEQVGRAGFPSGVGPWECQPKSLLSFLCPWRDGGPAVLGRGEMGREGFREEAPRWAWEGHVREPAWQKPTVDREGTQRTPETIRDVSPDASEHSSTCART